MLFIFWFWSLLLISKWHEHVLEAVTCNVVCPFSALASTSTDDPSSDRISCRTTFRSHVRHTPNAMMSHQLYFPSRFYIPSWYTLLFFCDLHSSKALIALGWNTYWYRSLLISDTSQQTVNHLKSDDDHDDVVLPSLDANFQIFRACKAASPGSKPSQKAIRPTAFRFAHHHPHIPIKSGEFLVEIWHRTSHHSFGNTQQWSSLLW